MAAVKPRELQHIDKVVGHNIRTRRIALGLTQEYLAAKLQISYQQVHKYEHGASRLSSGRLQQLANLLGVPMVELFKDTVPAVEMGRSDRAGLELLRVFMTLEASDKRAILGLAKSLAKRDGK